MIYDGLLSLELPSTLGGPLPTSLSEGLEGILFEGRWRRRAATCSISTGAALAACYAALRGLGVEAVALRGDAEEGLALQIPSERYGEAPPPWPELIPEAWTREPCAFSLSALARRPGLAAAVRLRFSPRHRPSGGALVGALRVAWSPALDGAGADDPTDGDPLTADELEAALAAALDAPASLRTLRRSLETWGEHLGASLLDGLAGALPGCRGHADGGAVALFGVGEEPERFAELLAGLPSDATWALPGIEGACRRIGAWPAIDRAGVRGRLRCGRFSPGALIGGGAEGAPLDGPGADAAALESLDAV